ncbi:Zn-ribbon domain-containing OB-fold protein [Neobacillus mesonae]|uniref:Zn-ribbon domain-containing OB-fold protein n=1 Tax=Neobacillus mesonae TaxID=1193713 RepID=UPI00203BD347|nr:OB-fold domain-containing protein [Neobacillus mesonae]MCM3568510.1 OB-fold domain-containing protein [Neobacillus mesonae]
MKLSVHVCEECGHTSIPARLICPSCRAVDFREEEREGKGTVYTFTKINISSVEFKHLTPYYVVIVDLPTGERVTGRMAEEVQINDVVELAAMEQGAYIFKKCG